MIRKTNPETARLVRDGAQIDRAIVAAHHRVIRRHLQLGIPLAVWRDGQVVEVAPDSLDPDGQELQSEDSRPSDAAGIVRSRSGRARRTGKAFTESLQHPKGKSRDSG